ncbi:restriction endonuclease subunit S [Shewanella sp. FJAT-52076]|uniref:restriction endonuclease subunit S n=1 Tax=Shewanella sp. FJAT-52076 TaxID=2864202 RepID=UPI001C660FDC|nr:restriction endonuclease subunit S [Shewanella sp. FJAT-52076]QYJ75714.1 restriction endonuclease subunit S [Shewanella sp. FJAT-52076]
MMKQQTYSEYKESGVKWLGQVPGHWNAVSLKWISQRYSGGTPDKSNDAYWENGDIPWLNSGSVNDGYITEPSTYITREGFASSSAKWIPTNALVMALAGQGKTKGMVAQLGIRATCNQSMAAIIPKEKFTPRFLYWWLVSNYQNIRNMAGGEQRDGLNLDMLGSIPCPQLPLPEQTAIADFLDRETGRIDILMAKKRQLIALLKDKRSALISRIVTRGLPEAIAGEFGLEPHTRFKDSGIEWLGQVPEEWDVLPFTKYVGEKSDYRGKTPEKTDDGIFLVTAKNVRMGFIDYETSKEYVAKEDYDEIMRRGLPKLGDILFTTEAPLGNVALVDDENVAMAQRIIRFRMRPKRFESKFTLYGMMSDHFQNQLKSLSTGSTAEGLKASKLTILRLICPPLPEQTAIAAYLDRETAKLDRLVEKVDAAIVCLQEYRTALITAAVTGKIDVREVVV